MIKIRAGGFSGIADTLWVGERQQKTCVKLNVGERLGDMPGQLESTVSRMIFNVEKSKDKLYCTGLMMQETYSDIQIIQIGRCVHSDA